MLAVNNFFNISDVCAYWVSVSLIPSEYDYMENIYYWTPFRSQHKLHSKFVHLYCSNQQSMNYYFPLTKQEKDAFSLNFLIWKLSRYIPLKKVMSLWGMQTSIHISFQEQRKRANSDQELTWSEMFHTLDVTLCTMFFCLFFQFCTSRF
jgi:hypothetical protein